MGGFVNVRRRFGVFLEVWGPGAEARRNALGIAEAEAGRLREEFSGVLLHPEASRTSVESVLGPATDYDGFAAYDLLVRENYLFAFAFQNSRLSEAAYVWNGHRTFPTGSIGTSREKAHLRDVLSTSGASWNELLALLGEPDDRSGWWPIDAWTYGPGLALELRLGVIENVGPSGNYPVPTYRRYPAD